MMVEIPMLQDPAIQKFLSSSHLQLWTVPAEEKMFFSVACLWAHAHLRVGGEDKNCTLPAFKVRYQNLTFRSYFHVLLHKKKKKKGHYEKGINIKSRQLLLSDVKQYLNIMVASLLVSINIVAANGGEGGKGTCTQLCRWRSLGRRCVGAAEDSVLPPGREQLQLPCQTPRLLL